MTTARKPCRPPRHRVRVRLIDDSSRGSSRRLSPRRLEVPVRTPLVVVPLLAAVAAAALPAQANAGQILFAHSAGRTGSDIWIMNDDGSNARPFIKRSDIPEGNV